MPRETSKSPKEADCPGAIQIQRLEHSFLRARAELLPVQPPDALLREARNQGLAQVWLPGVQYGDLAHQRLHLLHRRHLRKQSQLRWLLRDVHAQAGPRSSHEFAGAHGGLQMAPFEPGCQGQVHHRHGREQHAHVPPVLAHEALRVLRHREGPMAHD